MHASNENIQTARSSRKNQPIWLMVTLFALLLVYPAFAGRPIARIVLNIFLTLILVSSAVAMWKQSRLLLVGLCLGVPAIMLAWLRTCVDLGTTVAVIGQGMISGFLLYIAVSQVIKALAGRTVTINTLCRAVSAYILIGIAWAGIYQMLILIDPSAITHSAGKHNWSMSLYFSFTVLTTLGFGDITPVSAYARSLVIVESIIGPMYLAVLIARLVAMYNRPPAAE
jgi:hypothetical protein